MSAKTFGELQIGTEFRFSGEIRVFKKTENTKAERVNGNTTCYPSEHDKIYEMPSNIPAPPRKINKNFRELRQDEAITLETFASRDDGATLWNVNMGKIGLAPKDFPPGFTFWVTE